MGILKFFGLQRIKDADKHTYRKSKLWSDWEKLTQDNNIQRKYEADVMSGVSDLKKIGTVDIYDDGRGYELALDIKKAFVFDYKQQIARSIKITSTKSPVETYNKIRVSIIPTYHG